MPSPTESMIHIDAPLSDIAVAYKPDPTLYIADQVFPIVEVNKQSDYYYIWTKGFWLRNAVERRAPGDTYPRGRLELSNTTYYADIYHLAFAIADEDRDQEDPAVQLEISGAEWLASQFAMNREVNLAATIFAASWATNLTGTTDFVQWSDFDDSNPLTDMITGINTIQQSTGQRANTLIMGKEVADQLCEHPLLLDKFKYTGAGVLEYEELRKALRIEKLLVGESVYDDANEGATASGGYIWGKNALLLHVPSRPGLRVAAAGYTFVWKMRDAGGYTVSIQNVRDELTDTDLLKGKHAFDHKIVSTDLGYYFASAVA